MTISEWKTEVLKKLNSRFETGNLTLNDLTVLWEVSDLFNIYMLHNLQRKPPSRSYNAV